MTSDHYDLIVIGSGPAGASLAQKVARTGKRILLLERGDYLPRTMANWSAKAVFIDGTYHAGETWYDVKGRPFRPGLHYYVGGNSKVYGAALLRLRERDFDVVRHYDGLSPAWPIGYADFEPYYAEAEKLFHVHGLRGEDPNEPWSSGPFPYPAVQHEKTIQGFSDVFAAEGLRPFHLPLGILLDEKDGKPTPKSICVRCDAFDGFPCLVNGKADAQVVCVDPALAAHKNLTLLTNAYVSRLETDASGRTVKQVLVTRNGEEECYSADIVVVSCGALSSALLLFRSANDRHPDGLANGSGQLGRNYLRHNQSVLLALLRDPNDDVFQKTLAVSDFYFGADDSELPLGLIQMCAAVHPEQIRIEALPTWLEWMPGLPFETMARHSIAFWLSTEDLPRAENRIYYDEKGRVRLDLVDNNLEPHRRLRRKMEQMMDRAGARVLPPGLYFHMDVPLAGTSHQAGTARFGTSPDDSVLDANCRAHQLDNLYVVDASFFPSIGAVNPTLTIVANALRVADHIAERLGS
ncbi:MAG TPA: GMC family oxidoreductase [Rhizomicrobium sp.]|nr:GMC family oxidoreductase [Rhizomicrobium sp.]